MEEGSNIPRSRSRAPTGIGVVPSMPAPTTLKKKKKKKEKRKHPRGNHAPHVPGLGHAPRPHPILHLLIQLTRYKTTTKHQRKKPKPGGGLASPTV